MSDHTAAKYGRVRLCQMCNTGLQATPYEYWLFYICTYCAHDQRRYQV